jgi:uncharacterized membrane protein YbhN (UPF0104 family)/tRNA A-37 threonylcarbamoyl transferase component Bud32
MRDRIIGGRTRDAMTESDDSLSKRRVSSARSLLDTQVARASAVSRAPLFPSERVAPRRRRPSDVARLIVTALAFVLLGWASSNDPPVDIRVAELFADLPGWIRTLSWVAYSGAGMIAVLLVVLSLFDGGIGRGLFRDLFWAIVTSLALGLFAAQTATGNWPDMLPEFISTEDLPPFPTLRTTLVVIVALVIGGYVNAQVKGFLRVTVAASVVAPLFLGLTTPTALLGAITLSLFSVALVRLAFGSPEGLPSIDRLQGTLEGVGVVVTELAYRDEQPGTVGVATAVASDGRPLDIKIYGIDAASQQQAERAWRSLWYRSAGPSPRSGRTEQAQHEALAVLSARDAGVNVPSIVAAGQSSNGDVLLVSIGPAGEPLDDPTDGELRDAWRELRALHTNARITHGEITSEAVRVAAGTIELVGLSKASMFPTEQQIATDIASMLATQAIASSSTRAVAAAAEIVERDVLEGALPFVQQAAMEPDLRKRLKVAGVDAESLRQALAEQLDIEVPELAAVKRVKISDVVIVFAAIIAANALVSQIANVGLDTLADELKGASVAWLVVAFLIKMASYSTAYISLKAVVVQPLPFSPTVLLQSAKSFVGLVVPSVVGAVGMNIRFLQNLGVPLALATTQGPVIGFIGFIAEVVLLVLCAWAIGRDVDAEVLTDFNAGGLLLIALLVVVVGLAIVMAIPKIRTKIVPPVRAAFTAVKEIISSPRTLGTIFGGEALDKIFGALALAATMAAFGASISFASLIFVSVGTGLLAGLAPVPGGIGVAEATMTALLTAVGIPAEQAVSIAIIHRVVTSYLPPVLGFFSLNWLTKQKYL